MFFVTEFFYIADNDFVSIAVKCSLQLGARCNRTRYKRDPV